jgi:hypothetical protein
MRAIRFIEGQHRPLPSVWSSKQRYVGKTCKPTPASRSWGIRSSVFGTRLNFVLRATVAS